MAGLSVAPGTLHLLQVQLWRFSVRTLVQWLACEAELLAAAPLCACYHLACSRPVARWLSVSLLRARRLAGELLRLRAGSR